MALHDDEQRPRAQAPSSGLMSALFLNVSSHTAEDHHDTSGVVPLTGSMFGHVVRLLPNMDCGDMLPCVELTVMSISVIALESCPSNRTTGALVGGIIVGDPVGILVVGSGVGSVDGSLVGSIEGVAVGVRVGFRVVGTPVGMVTGAVVGVR